MNDQYYILKDDDIIQQGDEWSIDARIWRRCGNSVGYENGVYRLGWTVLEWQVRRKIKTTPLGNIYDNR
jgi:hypothetical protein